MRRKASILLILLLLSFTVTVFLYFYWSTESDRSNLFAFNLTYTIFLELVFFGFIYFTKLNSKEVSGAVYSVLGTILFFYLIFGITTLLSFNLFLLKLVSVKWYYSLLLIGTFLGALFLGFALSLNNSLITHNKTTESSDDLHYTILKELERLENVYKTSLSRKGITETFESEYDSAMNKLINKLKFINPKCLDNESTYSELSQRVNLIKNYLTELNYNESDSLSIHQTIIDCINETISFVKPLK